MSNEQQSSNRSHPQRKQRRSPLVLDLETGDPDDLFTLMLAAAHPKLNLLAVTITPGSQDQIVLVKYILESVLGLAEAKQVLVGAQEWPRNQKKKKCVDLEKWTAILHPNTSHNEDEQQRTERDPVKTKKKSKKGKKESGIRTDKSANIAFKPTGQVSEWDIQPARELVAAICHDHPEVTLLTCGPTHNLGAAIAAGAKIHRWVAQGGFCGSNFVDAGVVPSVFPKFEGLTHVASWNFGGSIEATLAALQAGEEVVARRVLVGKNICHACTYDEYVDGRLKEFLADSQSRGRNKKETKNKAGAHRKAVQWLNEILTAKYQTDGIITNRKALHDLLALATTIDESVCQLVEVQVDVVDGNKWGAMPVEEPGKTRTFAAIAFDREKFVDALLV
ncbi:Inosine-uridine preferring nucleoside hydrolase [Seminavis robusta]|uniref:Inosine-uridine preferring nucleoside hydrolase n=1 Tax=Seminavis robusta TaxID=568900 RepID=A0A9N8DHT1_9STRA|nr:Inosine-uridine preferring nucleoside hydrolase [Seminavis robusta]|eukprot:Sro94_g049080.1 Inosine-uridine preferring nucleoside hydrolase (391) ;mRNA; r:90472-91644